MKFVVQICISVIQIHTSLRKFSIDIIQIKIRVGSIQIRHRAGKRLFEHSNSHMGIQIRNKIIQFSMYSILRMRICIHQFKQNVKNNRLYFRLYVFLPNSCIYYSIYHFVHRFIMTTCMHAGIYTILCTYIYVYICNYVNPLFYRLLSSICFHSNIYVFIRDILYIYTCIYI